MPKLNFDIDKLLKDKKSFPDDLVIKLGNDAELSLADIRAYNDQQGGALADELKKTQKEWDKIKAEQGKVSKAAEEVAKLYLDLEEKQKQLGKTNRPEADPFDELAENDPLAKHVRSLRDSHATQIGALEKKLDQLLKNQGEMGKVYMNDVVRNDYFSLKGDPDYSADLTLEGVFDYAIKKGIKRSDGIPDVKSAYEQLVQPKRTERLVREAKEAGKREAEEARKREAFMPPPGAMRNGISPSVLRGPGGPGNESQPPRNLREALARAQQDPTMYGITEGNA